METFLLLSLLVSLCVTGVTREIANLDKESDRRQLSKNIDELEREQRFSEDAKELLTYNIGMLPAVSRFSERRPAIPDVFSNLNADLVCIQEAWFLHDVATILDVTSEKYPYSYSFRHSDLSTLDEAHMQRPPCDNLLKFSIAIVCAIFKCIFKNLSGFQLLECASQKCGLLDLGQDCASCVMYSGGIMEHILKCASSAYSLDHLGLLVLSKEEPTSYSVTFFDPGPTQFLPRGYIQLEFSDLKTVLCLHLSAIMETYPEPLPYGSYLKQQEAEILKLVDLAKTKEEMVILGDVNTGPAVPENDIQLEGANNYQIFKDNNFKSPFEDDVSECTWCGSNCLINSNISHMIDFILLYGNMEGSNAERVFDENLPELDCTLSDHYGVKMKVWRTQLSMLESLYRWTCRWTWLPWCKKEV